MTPEVQCGVCMFCGKPMYVPQLWWGVTPPPIRQTCSCKQTQAWIQPRYGNTPKISTGNNSAWRM